MKPDQPIDLDQLIRALAQRPGLPGLTPVTRSSGSERKTAAIVADMLERLRRQAGATA